MVITFRKWFKIMKFPSNWQIRYSNFYTDQAWNETWMGDRHTMATRRLREAILDRMKTRAYPEKHGMKYDVVRNRMRDYDSGSDYW